VVIGQSRDIDPVHSHVGLVSRHMMLSKVRGRFDRFEGQIITADDPLRSSVAVTIDMNSVNTGNELRDNDQRSVDFFDAANYPVHGPGADYVARNLNHGAAPMETDMAAASAASVGTARSERNQSRIPPATDRASTAA
jgi:YceI-like domain